MNTSAHRAPEPVHRTILVPLDGSHLADGALATAQRHGSAPRRRGARTRHRA